MRHPNRFTTALAAGALLFLGVLFPLTAGAETKKHWWTPRIRSGSAEPTENAEQEVPTTPASPPPAPAQATKPSPTPAPAAAAAPTAAGTTAAPATGAAPAIVTAAAVSGTTAPAGKPAPPPPMPGSDVVKLCKALRDGAIGKEANSRAYIDLIEAGQASPAQVNDFAAYLARRGMPKIALKFQQYAVQLAPNDTTLLLNLGTLYQNVNEHGSAESAFKKAIAIDPNNALAHYNLGVSYDAQKDYDSAIEQYRIALVIDPELGDARKNPQIVNNEHMLEVKLQIYRNLAGSIGLPLKQMQPATEAKGPSPAQKK